MDSNNDLLDSLRRFHEAEARYSASRLAIDREALLATLHPDIILYQPESLPYGGQWKGREEFGCWLDAFVNTWADVVPTDPVFHVCGAHNVIVTVTMRAKAKATGTPIEIPMCQVVRFSDRLPIEWRNFSSDTVRMLNALEAPAPQVVCYEQSG